MARAILLVMDSVGIGGAPDAADFGDEGSDTFGHIAAACAAGEADNDIRKGPLQVPNMNRLGLCRAAEASTGRHPDGIERIKMPQSIWGHASEVSKGKDTPSGHWELAGLPVPFQWGYFPQTVPTFPADLTDALIEQAALPGILGNKHASGTQIIAELGEEHVSSGKPICYTSADSVMQIAAHEDHFGLDRLYSLCEIARPLCDPLNIGRVIARPFLGESADTFQRTANRRDYSVPPPGVTLLDHAVSIGRRVFSIGKIDDIFAHRGITDRIKADGNDALFDATLQALNEAGPGDLVFANFIDFDQLYGHRRDVAGYAACLEAFDRRLPELESQLVKGDFAVLTADHGNDPTWTGTDHTRENVPVLAFGPGLEPRSAGHMQTFADVGQTLAAHLALPPMGAGASFI